MKMKLPRSSHNWLTLAGTTVALISLSMIVFLLIISSIWREGHAYLGLVTFMLLPVLMIFGLLLIPLGMLLKKRQIARSGEAARHGWPMVDLNYQPHRNAFMIFAGGTTLFLFLSAVGSYEAFHYTESTEFCGELCHSVMAPEYTAYKNSPHARVDCVDCHVGSGPGFYARAKLNGVRQVISLFRGSFARPIPTPIENLRPARETCETCHWPDKFYSRKLRMQTHFLQDEDNTRWDIQLLMKIGAEHPALGLKEGIHWHINSNIRVEYIAGDKRKDSLPWVRYTNLKTGETTIYEDEENPLDETDIRKADIRTMDCMDCHTRPSHNYLPPVAFINEAMLAGEISSDLPEIKLVLTEAADADYPSLDSAFSAIEKEALTYYEEEYPEIYEEKRELLDQAIAAMKQRYSENTFPEMKVRWDAYPDQIGHLRFDGCFRCHNGTHASESGKTISMDCNLCHAITAQGTAGSMQYAAAGESLEFRHPDGDDDWKDTFCSECHGN